VDQRGGLTIVQAETDFSLLGRLDELRNMGCRSFIVDLSHIGPFSPEGKKVLEALRRGQDVPGTSPFNYERGME
jgi:putative protease